MTDEERLAEFLESCREQRDGGEPFDPEAVCDQHPHLAGELRLRMQALDLVEQAYQESRLVSESVPAQLGEYEIRRELGRGGMGVVYEAFQESMEREVALKVLFPSVTGSQRAIDRFQREARAAGRVQHTNLVPVYTMGQIDGVWFYAMELVHGVSLNAVLRTMRERKSAPEPNTTAGLSDTHGTVGYYRDVARLFAGVADALQAAHDEGILHRDLKPSNLILDAKGVLKIIDFGVARIGDEKSDVTATGELIGTPVYMSPEQARGRSDELDHRADLYSLGAALYEALTLKPPFQGKSYGEIYEQVVREEPIPPRRENPRVAKDLETVVLKAMEKEPDKRYQAARQMARDLRAFADGSAISARPVGFAERLWRKARRHKALTVVTTCLALAVLVAGGMALHAGEEEGKRRNAQYDLRVQEATAALSYTEERGNAGPRTAAALFEQAIRIAPGRTEAYVGLALDRGRSVDARLDDLAAARERGLPADTASRLRAFVLHDGGRYEDAAKAELHLPASPESPATLEALALGLRSVQDGDVDGAIGHLTQAVRAAPSTSLYGYMARRARAPLLARKGRLREALDDLHATRARGDRSVDRTLLTAALWRRVGQEGKAESLLAESLAEEIQTEAEWYAFLEASHHLQGQLLCEQGDPEAGLSALRRAVALPGSHESTRILLVKALLREGHQDEAVSVLEQAMRGFPKHGRPPTWMGLVLTETAQADLAAMERAQALARLAIRIGGAGSLPHCVLAIALHRQGKHQAALDALLPIANAGRAEFMAVSVAVLAHCALGEIAEARARLENSIATVHPSDRRWQTNVERRLRKEALAVLDRTERAGGRKSR